MSHGSILILELFFCPSIHYDVVLLSEGCCALALDPTKSARVTDYPETNELHILLHISAIEQEATEVLRTHPF